jgi:hypothetical protein
MQSSTGSVRTKSCSIHGCAVPSYLSCTTVRIELGLVSIIYYAQKPVLVNKTVVPFRRLLGAGLPDITGQDLIGHLHDFLQQSMQAEIIQGYPSRFLRSSYEPINL